MDRLDIEYLRNKGKRNMSDHEFMDKFKDFMEDKYRRDSMRYDNMPMEDHNEYYRRHGRPEDYMDMMDYDRPSSHYRHGMDDDDMYRMMKYMRDSMGSSDHFSESEAKHIVSEMYHTENGRKHSGEKFPMSKAKEICERYRGILPTSVTPADVYVAINAQYHDYSELLKSWFGDNIDSKVIESAIVFWFKDADYGTGNKLADYFRG